MKTFMSTLLIGLSLCFSTYAKESVAFVTHKVVVGSDGMVKSVVPMRSELIIPENSPTTIKDHYANITKAETLFDFKKAFNNAIDKTVNVVSGDTFKKVAGGVVAVAGTVAAGVGAYSALKDKTNKNDWSQMNKDYGQDKLNIDRVMEDSQYAKDHPSKENIEKSSASYKQMKDFEGSFENKYMKGEKWYKKPSEPLED